MAAEQTPFKRIASDFLDNPVAVFGLVLFGLILLTAILAPLISPQNPYDLSQLDVMDSRLPPGSQSINNGTFWLGTDDQGRDMLSAIFYGLRISLSVGVMSTVIALAIGLAMGLAAAYFGGKTETLYYQTTALTTANLGTYGTVSAADIASGYLTFVPNADVTTQGSFQFKVTDTNPPRIDPATEEIIITFQGGGHNGGDLHFGHDGMLYISTGDGRGPNPPDPLNTGQDCSDLLSGKYWISFFPGIALLLTIVSINLVADQLRDVLNPRLQR